MKDLAIVIPFYKKKYFSQTLESLAAQTSKDFTLYVGDDASPEDISGLLELYADRMEIVYHRFEDNMGGKNLVQHWHRCIGLTKGEPWLWLFSDDDIVDPHCVEAFLGVKKSTDYDVYHFDVQMINASGENLKPIQHYPTVIWPEELFYKKKTGKLQSFVVENVFSRKIYEKFDGFCEYPLAWGSDLVTWCRFSMNKGMRTVEGPVVCWRSSELNISPNNTPSIRDEKMKADKMVFYWFQQTFSPVPQSRMDDMIIRHLLYYSLSLDFKSFLSAIRKYVEERLLSRMGAVLCLALDPLYKTGKAFLKK